MVAEKTDLTGAHEKCTKRPALNVKKNVKYRSSPLKAGLFTVETASQSEGNIKRYSDIPENINRC